MFQQEILESIFRTNDQTLIDRYKPLTDDEEYLKRQFAYRCGCPLNLDHPKTYNEKIQWLKLHDRNPEYIRMVDKYEAKKYVADRIGGQYIIPTWGYMMPLMRLILVSCRISSF
jgi:hypothetical protein